MRGEEHNDTVVVRILVWGEGGRPGADFTNHCSLLIKGLMKPAPGVCSRSLLLIGVGK